jgi:AraC-like DNA-binding protein
MHIVFGVGAFQTFIFSLLLLTKKEKKLADKFLAGFFFVITIYLLNLFSVRFGLWQKHPNIFIVNTLVYLTYGPLLYFYVCSLVGNKISKRRLVYHLIPIIITFLIVMPFLFRSNSEKLLYFTDKYINLPLNISVGAFIQYLSAPIYFVWTIVILQNHKQYLKDNHSSIDKINLDWMRKLLFGVIIIRMIEIFNAYALNFSAYDLYFGGIVSFYIKITFLIFIIIIGYYGINQGNIFVHHQTLLNSNGNNNNINPDLIPTKTVEENVKILIEHLRNKELNNEIHIRDIASNLSIPVHVLSHLIKANARNENTIENLEKVKLICDQKAKKHTKELVEYMQNEKVYLNSELRMQDIAVNLEIPAHILSYIINTILNQNFYDFINQYRIKEAKNRLNNLQYKNLTIVAIAYDCGFNSKATFNRLFKQYTGLTPSQFRNSIQ